jgi:hypothetical protein
MSFPLFYFLVNALQGSPVELNTTTEGICADLIPKSRQAFGKRGSHVTVKYMQ